MKNIRKAFGLGLEKKRVASGLSQQSMADLLGISLSTYRRIASGESELRGIEILSRLYDHDNTFAFEVIEEQSDLLDLVKKLKKLNSMQLRFINAVVDFELEMQPDSETEITVITPTGDMEDGMLWDSCNLEKRKVCTYVDATEGILVTSNHLHPVYVTGDILLIDNRPIRDGDTGIFINKETHRAYLRKFRQTKPCELVPVNGFGKTFYVDPESPDDMDRWYKFGVVLTKVR